MKIDLAPALVCSAALWLSACSQDAKTDAAGPDSEPQASGPKAYVGLFGDNAVAVIDTATNQVIKKVAVPAGPHGVVITPDGAKVYVSSDGATTVSVIATDTDSVSASIEVGMTPHGLSISPDGRHVLLSDFGADQAELIDTETDTVSAHTSVSRPHNSAISADGTLGFEGSQQADAPAIVLVDLRSAEVTGKVELEHAPRALDFGPNGLVYFTVSGVDALESLNPTTLELGTPIPTGGSPHHMLATKDGAYELVVSQTAGELQYVDPTRQSVVASVATGTAPHWIGLSSDGQLAYVTNEGSGDVSVIDLAAREVLQTIAVGQAPRKIAVQPSRR
jgi:YVTN family beta-propeller protein